jgi:excisionase family DNA binding protein
MSLEASLPKSKRAPWKQRAFAPVCVTIDEFVATTGLSRQTTYRWMADGRLRYVQLGERMRRIPTSEFARLGLGSPTA